MTKQLGVTQVKVLRLLQQQQKPMTVQEISKEAKISMSNPSLKYALDTLSNRYGYIAVVSRNPIKFMFSQYVGREDALKYEVQSITPDSTIFNSVVKKHEGYSKFLLLYYNGALKKQGIPVILRNDASGRFIAVSKVEMEGFVKQSMSFNNAPKGIMSEGPTTIQYIEALGEDSDAYPDCECPTCKGITGLE